MVKSSLRWDPEPGDRERIQEHLERQRGLKPGQLRLDNGHVVREGLDCEGEGEHGDH